MNGFRAKGMPLPRMSSFPAWESDEYREWIMCHPDDGPGFGEHLSSSLALAHRISSLPLPLRTTPTYTLERRRVRAM